MATTQAFRNALHIPLEDPEAGNSVVTLNAADHYLTAWSEAGGGAAFPSPDKPDQMLVSGPAPDYLWTLVDTLDAGVYA